MSDFPQYMPLAGVASYEEAAQLGYTVQEDVDRFVRYAWLEKAAMEMGMAWINPTPDWEVKEALSLHLYLDAEHVAQFRERVSEMRNPPPRMDVSPDPSLQAFIDEVMTAQDTLERVVGLYGVLKPALIAAYREHLSKANPLVDYPTRRMLKHILLDEEEIMHWGESAVRAVSLGNEERAAAWANHLQAYLAATGGVMGAAERTTELPVSRVQGPFVPDFTPKRDARFTKQWNFVFPPHEVARTEGVPNDEKTLALMCKRALEMDVPEAMVRMMWEAKGHPWEYYTGMGRQVWDEARHAMMGTVYLQNRGIQWKELPLHPGFSLRLNKHMTASEAHAVLYTIEQSLMPATTGKAYEWVTAGASQDELAQLFQDFDWADEVLHVYIGREWLLSTLNMSRTDAVTLGQQRATETESILELYAANGEQVNWWSDFVQQVLGRPSAMQSYSMGTGDPVYRKKKN